MDTFIAILLLWLITGFLTYCEDCGFIAFTVLAGSGLFLIRAILIMLGVYKDPILHRYEKYGGEETFYYPVPSFLFCLCLFVIGSNAWFSSVINWRFPGNFIGLLLFFSAWIAHRFTGYFKRHPYAFLMVPRWLYQLQENTTRLERRRIAYMWLRLPWRLRFALNSSDRAFLQWADFVILATLM